ncbi:MAG: hypothetical protein GDA45_06375 [Chromatiales bacterium]|nr:hypothetical protein [Chromatiales bacterium]
MDIINFLQNYYQAILTVAALLGGLLALVIMKAYFSFVKWRTEAEFKLDDLEPIRKNAKAITELLEKSKP